MFIVISFLVSIIVYVNTFMNDFQKEDIDKAAPFLIVLTILSILLIVLGGIN